MRKTATAALAASLVLASLAGGQVVYNELEVSAGANDTFALAEDCRLIGNFFEISGSVVQGNPNSDNDWFMFNGDAGATVDLVMTIVNAVSTSGTIYQHNFYLWDSAQVMVAAWNNVRAAPPGPTIGIETFTLPATDTYYIGVAEWSVYPFALQQGGVITTPLSTRGYSVSGVTPDATFDTAGGNQTYGSTYTLTVTLSAGNDPGTPSCVITAPMPPAVFTGIVPLTFDVDDPTADPLTATFEWSSDAGVTFHPCTPGGGSPLPNPAPGLASPQVGLLFEWDTDADSVGQVVVDTVDLKVTVDDGTSTSDCTVSGIDVDNTALCQGICGDCDLNGSGPDILDALVAAQIGALLLSPTPDQVGCCDVNSSGAIDVIDALLMAQAAALLPVTPVCP